MVPSGIKSKEVVVVLISPDVDTSPVDTTVDQNRRVSALGRRYGIDTLGNIRRRGDPPGDSGT